jgi:ankyrin repeat protein
MLAEKKWTLLHLAVSNDDISHTRSILLSGNIDINAVTHKGRTALHCAISRRNVDIIRLLLLHGGCDVSIRDIDNKSPLDLLLEENSNSDPRTSMIRNMLELYSQK